MIRFTRAPAWIFAASTVMLAAGTVAASQTSSPAGTWSMTTSFNGQSIPARLTLVVAQHPNTVVLKPTQEDLEYLAEAPKVFLGIRLGSSDVGVAIAEVIPDTAAAEAGLQAEDRLLRIGDTAIEERRDVRRALRKFEPDDPVDVVVLRAGQETTVKVILRGRS